LIILGQELQNEHPARTQRYSKESSPERLTTRLQT
jgi:hypothetical protein